MGKGDSSYFFKSSAHLTVYFSDRDGPPKDSAKSLKDMKEMLGNLPQFQEMKAKVECRIDLLTFAEEKVIVFSTFEHCSRVPVRL